MDHNSPHNLKTKTMSKQKLIRIQKLEAIKGELLQFASTYNDISFYTKDMKALQGNAEIVYKERYGRSYE